MIRRSKPLPRQSSPIKRRKRPKPMRTTPRANLARRCAQLWSRKVREKNGGRCVLEGRDGRPCFGVLDPAHAFPKGTCTAVRYDPDFGLPVCRGHHDYYGNGDAWRMFLFCLWGAELYAERYAAAHRAGKQDLRAALAALEAA